MNEQPAVDERREFVLAHARLVGGFLILAGLGLAYICIYQPMQDAETGAAKVDVSIMGALVAVISLALGPGYLIGGRRFVELIWPPPGPWRLGSYLMFVAVLALGGAIFWGFRTYLINRGYDF
jgi:hypothetical protein